MMAATVAPSVMDGRISSEIFPVYPATGNQPRYTEKSWSNKRPSQNWGMEVISQERDRTHLRGHLTEGELIFTALAELSTRKFAESVNATGMPKNKEAGITGGKMSKKARLELEEKTGKSVITSENYLRPAKKSNQLKKNGQR